jgi:2-polyprenyl-3-methyl-5-hydroxy-6-metoxy-1,4-benzoquinol methylase
VTDPSSAAPTSGDRSHDAEHAAFGSQWWEQHYQGQEPGRSAPSPHLVAGLTGRRPGTALDAGCGTGADAVWLAQEGWQVTAVDISPTVVGQAERLAAEQSPDLAARVTWVVADLTVWEPPVRYDLVVSQYVHPDVPFPEFVGHLARSVGPRGTLFVAGHDHADSHSTSHAPAPASIGPEAVTSALSPDVWDVEVAETRTRQVRHGPTEATMHDLVVRARRKGSS